MIRNDSLNPETIMKAQLQIAVAQLQSTPDIEHNLNTMRSMVERAAQRGCDLIMFPECAPQMRPDKERVHESESLEGKQVSFCRDLCVKHEIGLLLGSFAEKRPEDPARFSNTSVFIDRAGEIVASYRKIHLFEAWMDGKRTHHEAGTVMAGPAKPIVAAFEGWNFGLSICYDLRFPELYRLLVDAGAHVLCVPSAFTYETGAAHWETLLRARAIENTRYVIAPAQTRENYPGRRTWGHSMAVAPWGEVIGQIGHDPGFFIVDLHRETLQLAEDRNPSLKNRVFQRIS